ncbi:anaerobic ribonucleoside-triphosphate reductase activating protein [Clostridium sp. 'deep sea']|uniref:anaerobic ribonucleoside-triphosphate reductase activating protein n=1 Tax=Clostridium sp. 'deep sea' TaxID=2779445 RepID=UPI0018965F1D|nr:anaerobic ribonucleoside-triphosphate reductase activating protein [Clostridium sp. 'deep sea']QOR34720.1 anaerobic ribonucleoside-triphosphate reductase activating protein [Clostridium sp. 'deep sea']
MIIDFMPVSFVDFPGNIATTVFIGGCNLNCCYCHNSTLLTAKEANKTEEEFLNYLLNRKHLIKGVCITGGEPTLWPNLINFIMLLKSNNFLVKLDTNGTNPKVLETLLQQNLLDYVAMDIKTTLAKYNEFGASESDKVKITSSVNLLKASNIKYEFRTTIMESLYTDADAQIIGEWLRGAQKYVLQGYKYNENVLNPQLCSTKNCELSYLEHLQEKLRPYFNSVKIRC